MLAILFIGLAIVGLIFIGIIIFIITKNTKDAGNKKAVEEIEREKLLRSAREKKAAYSDKTQDDKSNVIPMAETSELKDFFSAKE